MATVSFLIPTIGRTSLGAAIMSTGARKGDEVIVVPDIERSGGWGNAQRNEGMLRATCDYISFMDDDDWYVPMARQIIEDAIQESGGNRPILFKMRYPNGETLWKTKEVVPGNIGSPMILVPNDKKMLGTFPGRRNMADFLFVDAWKWPKGSIMWSEEVIAHLGHNNTGDTLHD